jgi:hypothetical protein
MNKTMNYEVEEWLLAAMGAVGGALFPCGGTAQLAV